MVYFVCVCESANLDTRVYMRFVVRLLLLLEFSIFFKDKILKFGKIQIESFLFLFKYLKKES